MPANHEPERIEPQSLDDYLEEMSRVAFQPGMSWRVVESKWPGTREAFKEFDADAVATMGEPEIDELAKDTRLIRNRRKIEAVVHNARRMIELEERHGGFPEYLRSHKGFDATVKDLRKQFKFLGEMGCYHFLYVVGEEVPPYEEWSASRG